MFDIYIQKSTSEKNKLNKNIENITTLSGTLKNECSILRPTIIIEAEISQLKDSNYMTIPEFNRKYFITEIKSIRSHIVEVSGRVDVLSTYADQIRLNTGIIKKQESKWNLYLNDGSLKVYQNPMILTKSFPSGFTTQEIVLAVAGS